MLSSCKFRVFFSGKSAYLFVNSVMLKALITAEASGDPVESSKPIKSFPSFVGFNASKDIILPVLKLEFKDSFFLTDADWM